jgi:hypothetical protein
VSLREIGRVARLQIQRASLKVGQKPNRVYDTAPLLSVARLSVSPAGAVALLPDGRTAIDVHQRDHPASQHAGRNGVSIGFTAHYARMRERFGAHLSDGCAGENILIETSDSIGLSDLVRGAAIRCSAAGVEVWLTDIVIARPCLEFSRHALQLPYAGKSSAEVKDALQFLEHGTRGFYVTPANHDGPVTVSLGDRVFVAA